MKRFEFLVSATEVGQVWKGWGKVTDVITSDKDEFIAWVEFDNKIIHKFKVDIWGAIQKY